MVDFRSSWALIFAAAGSALALQELAYGSTGMGLNVGLGSLAVLFIGGVLIRLSVLRPEKAALWGVLPFAVGSFGIALTDSRGLDLLNSVLILEGLGWMALYQLRSIRPSWVESLIIVPLASMTYPLLGASFLGNAKWRREVQGMPTAQKAILLGAILALPVLFGFGSILAQADPMFGKLVTPAVALNPDEVASRIMLFGFFAVASLCFFAAFLEPMRAKYEALLGLNSQPTFKEPSLDKSKHFGLVATTFLGLITALFGLFIVIQMRYLFGGEALLRAENLTYATYARRGFFEIATVVGLMIPLLLVFQRYLKPENGGLRAFKVVAALNASLLLALLGSAGFRMALYVDAYGLSPLRFYVIGAIAWMALILGAYLVFGLRWKLSTFSHASLASALGLAVIFNLAKPDLVIARYNLSKTERSVDGEMLINCGADAAPALIGTSYETAWRAHFAPADHVYSQSFSQLMMGKP